MSVVVRQLRREDKKSWLRLWTGYLKYYETNLQSGDNEKLFARLLSGAPHFGFVAESDGEVVGFVHAMPHASTWSMDGYCYLEDLFVAESARGSGVGRTLIEAVYAEADKRRLTRVYWHTEESNRAAQQLYDQLATKSDFVQYRR